jgi:hypothetical protein
MSKLPHFLDLDNGLRDGDEIVSPTRRPLFTPRKITDTHFGYRLSRPQDHSASERIKYAEKSHDLIGNRTTDLPACSIVSTPLTSHYSLNVLLLHGLYCELFTA